ncbi:hypothetical protein SAMN05216327_1254 [Dyadobacter sp. SG02]|uniref:hypothetical protein n=1 Tax=Dyadobacter sp. SG02 TaxID=1855291 RepID=UPI0008C1E10B|nr:hypothetical protein [Dyadobacter sp. SG02]SEJ84859.1 hypothetical protein SAMN05216327_1254 [Dyadobacter sp. SG02]
MENKQPWLGKPLTDIVFILAPPFLSLLVVIGFPRIFQDNAHMPDAWWVVLILLIDVAHVYSTLYRTYLNRQLYHRFKPLLIGIPVLALVIGSGIYLMSGLWFWRVLAYLAVYHFVRQQYGFMRLYSRFERTPGWYRHIDQFVIYYATIYPLLYWHLHGGRNFNWFIENEFLISASRPALNVATGLYFIMLAAYVFKEMHYWLHFRTLNIPRIAVITGTLVSWYFGIVYFNGDLAFTLLNVVSHGIPYMALIWVFGQKEAARRESGRWLPLFFGQYGVVLFLGLIFLLAYLEEGLWDWTVWKEHRYLFSLFHQFPLTVHKPALALIVPLLAVPQITHYVIDGFIWKKGNERH